MTNTHSRPTLTFWVPALLLATLGSWILYLAEPGVNWFIWTLSASLGMIAIRRVAGRAIARHTLVLLAWACLLTAGQAISANPAHTGIIFILFLLLLGLAIITLDEPDASRIAIPTVIRTPFVALWRVGRQALQELIAAPASASATRAHPAVRGAVMALPVVIVLVVLLSYSDPLLDSGREAIGRIFGTWSLSGRFVFFLFLAAVTGGTYALGAGRRVQLAPAEPDPAPPFRLAGQEYRILLSAVNAVLWIFVALQLASLARNPAGVAGTGVTYAEYARRGFAELSIAAAVVLVVLLFVQVFGEQTKPRTNRLELMAVVAIELVLLSAFWRVVRYEQAYGFTTERLVAQAFMIVLAVTFVLLARELARGELSSAFTRHVMMACLGAVTTFVLWNYEGWLVERNFARARETGRLDLAYLARLSPNATPGLISRLPSLTPEQRLVATSRLGCQRVASDRPWYEWNLRRDRASDLVAERGYDCLKGS